VGEEGKWDKELNNMTARQPGPLQIVQYSLIKYSKRRT
jgi:hypothetical protein